MRKKFFIFFASITSVALLSGCQSNELINSNNKETIYAYIDKSSKKDSFDSPIGLTTEEPIINNNNKVGNRLYVKSSKELLTISNVKKFYETIKTETNNYQEIVVEINKTEAIQIFIPTSEAWFCKIDENMNLIKVKQINY